jgi:hypothetical protein
MQWTPTSRKSESNAPHRPIQLGRRIAKGGPRYCAGFSSGSHEPLLTAWPAAQMGLLR